MAKTGSLAAIRKRTVAATQSLAEVDRDREQSERAESQKPLTIPLAEIKPRPGPNTRAIHPEHVIALAESIGTLGLIEPLVLDRENHLLAGGHRFAALQLLNTNPQERMALLEDLCERSFEKEEATLQDMMSHLEWADEESGPDVVPVRIVDFDATQEVERALAIEAAENTQRRDYTPKEVFALYNRLLAAGYTDRRGKPQKDEKPAKPAIATVIGKSVKTVERILKKTREKEEQGEGEASKSEEMLRALGLLEGAISRVLNCSAGFKESPEVQELVNELQKKRIASLIQQVRKALGES